LKRIGKARAQQYARKKSRDKRTCAALFRR
jgi:hypothetical protein